MTTDNEYKVEMLEVVGIDHDDDFNCRGAFTNADVVELAETIEVAGLQYPIIVRPGKGVLPWSLVAGFRRLRAFRLLKRDRIPCYVRDLSDREAAYLNLLENIERKDLNMVQEAVGIMKLFPELPTEPSFREAAKEIKKSVRWIQARWRLHQLDDEIKDLFASGRIAKRYLDAIWAEAPDKRLEIAQKLANRRDGRGVNRERSPFKSRHRNRSKAEIIQVIATTLDASIIGLAPRMAAYCAGFISEEELLEDIRKIKPQKIAKAEQRI